MRGANPAACDWHASSKGRTSAFSPAQSIGPVRELLSPLVPRHLFQARASCGAPQCSFILAGGVGNGYFACNAGDAGSNPALSASSGRLVAKDASVPYRLFPG